MDKGFWAYLRSKLKPKRVETETSKPEIVENTLARERFEKFRSVLPMVATKVDRNTTLRLVQTSKQIGDNVVYTGVVSRHAFEAFITTLGAVVLLLDDRDKLKVGYYQYWNNAVAQDNNNTASTNTRSNAWIDAMDANWKKLKPLLDKLLVQYEKIRLPQSNVLRTYDLDVAMKAYKHIDFSMLGKDFLLQDLYDDNAFPENSRVIAFNTAMSCLQQGYKRFVQNSKKNSNNVNNTKNVGTVNYNNTRQSKRQSNLLSTSQAINVFTPASGQRPVGANVSRLIADTTKMKTEGGANKTKSKSKGKSRR